MSAEDSIPVWRRRESNRIALTLSTVSPAIEHDQDDGTLRQRVSLSSDQFVNAAPCGGRNLSFLVWPMHKIVSTPTRKRPTNFPVCGVSQFPADAYHGGSPRTYPVARA